MSEFNFKCDCSLRERAVGYGCSICNTDMLFDLMPQPEEMKETLNENGFNLEQAAMVAEDIYQPLMSIFAILNKKIDQLAKAIPAG